MVGLGTASPSALSMVTADFNGDGVLDLATANSDGSVSILLGNVNSPGHFLPPAVYTSGTSSFGPTPSLSIVAADFNLDGLPDLAIIGSSAAILLNNPNSPGLFIVQPTIDVPAYPAAVAADFNGDGYPDLLIAADTGGATLYFGDPAHPGQFIPASTCSLFCDVYVLGLAVGDFNQDGVPDVAASSSGVSDLTLGMSIALGDPINRGNFLPLTNYALHSIAYLFGSYTAAGPVIGDFNGDGLPDLAMYWSFYSSLPVGNGSFVALFLNDPSSRGQFSLQSDLFSPTFVEATDTVAGDFTGNGLSDLAFGLNRSIQVLLDASSATATLTDIPASGADAQSIVASYSGDSNYQASVSPAQYIGGSIATATTLTTSAFVINAGDAITFTATVSSGQNSFLSWVQ